MLLFIKSEKGFKLSTMRVLLMAWVLVLNSISIEIEKIDGDIYLKDVPCDKFSKEIDNLAIWTKKTGRECPKDKIKIIKNIIDESLCSANISECIPQHVSDHHGLKSENDGPNCWNLALVMSGLNPYLNHTSEKEMKHFMKEPFCRKLGENEIKQPGDVGAMRDGEKELHGYIWISENLVYSKNGSRCSQPYGLMTTSEIQSYLENEPQYASGGGPMIGSSYRNSYFVSKKTIPNGEKHQDFYRCISMNEFLEKNKDKIGEDVQEAYENYKAIACHTGKVILQDGPLPKEEKSIELASQISEVLYKYLDNAKKPNLTETEKVVFKTLALQLQSISLNLESGILDPYNYSKEAKENLDYFRDYLYESAEIAGRMSEIENETSPKSNSNYEFDF